MRILWGNHIPLARIGKYNGYGYATENVVASLRRLGHQVSDKMSSPDVHFHFDQPQHFERKPGVFNVIYHPWESTLMKDGWAEAMNTADEVWTPSPLIAEWYAKYAGVTVPIYVYEHGVTNDWKPTLRKATDKVRFLHVGMEASRKGGQEAMAAFRAAFPEPKDVELNMKLISSGWKMNSIGRVNIINGSMPFRNLVRLFQVNHVFVYPSYGEGFGLNPLQAMATGMPVVTVPEWAPYKKFLDERISIGSTLIDSPWPEIHPGQMLKPNFDDIVDGLRYAKDNFEEVAQSAFQRTAEIKAYYDWDRLTKEAFDALEIRLGNS